MAEKIGAAGPECESMLSVCRPVTATSPLEFGYSVALSVHQEAADQDIADTDLCSHACGKGRGRQLELYLR